MGRESYPMSYLFLAIICQCKNLTEKAFIDSSEFFFSHTGVKEIKKENDVLFVSRDLLFGFTKFYYHLISLTSIDYVSRLSFKPDECKIALNELFEKKKIYKIVSDLFENKELELPFIEISKFYNFIPLNGYDVRNLIASLPKID